MKQLQLKEKLGKQEIVAQQEKQYEQVFQFSIKPHKGHTLFEINTITGEVKKATFESVDVKWEDAVNGIVSKRRKVIIKPDHIYISALNDKNAIKKYKQNKNEKI